MIKSNQYKISLFFAFLGLFLLGYVYRNMSFSELKAQKTNIYFKWIVFAAVAHLINHGLRSYRWSLLLKKHGQNVPFHKVYCAEMTGFFFNGLPGRLGEGMRCQSLLRMHNVPVKHALAGVMIERGVDMLLMVVFFIFSSFFFFSSFKSMSALAFVEMKKHLLALSNTSPVVFMLIVLGLILFVAWLLHSKHILRSISTFFKEVFMSVRIMFRGNSWLFWVCTILILLFYFLLEYLSLFALKATNMLSLQYSLAPAVCVFIALNFSHLIPTGHGLLLYQLLVPVALENFGVAKEDADIYATITYFIQLFNSCVIGGICMVISFKFKHGNTGVGTNKQL